MCVSVLRSLESVLSKESRSVGKVRGQRGTVCMIACCGKLYRVGIGRHGVLVSKCSCRAGYCNMVGVLFLSTEYSVRCGCGCIRDMLISGCQSSEADLRQRKETCLDTEYLTWIRVETFSPQHSSRQGSVGSGAGSKFNRGIESYRDVRSVYRRCSYSVISVHASIFGYTSAAFRA